jgi:spermidine dehydrogenase
MEADLAKRKPLGKKLRQLLGMDSQITRRDFLNTTLIGAGSMLINLPAPSELLAANTDWNGYGGVGDYAHSNGNTWEVLSVGHEVRDGRYDHLSPAPRDTGEAYDVVIVGGGISGLGAALHLTKKRRSGLKCLILENHPIFGGEAKHNEFVVDGQRLFGPQGSNNFNFPQRPDSPNYEIFHQLGMPEEFEHQAWNSHLKPLEFARDDYSAQFRADSMPSFGFFFEHQGKGEWVTDVWGHNLEGTPFSTKLRQDLLTWKSSQKKYYDGPDAAQWLDTMSYKDYIEKVMGLDPGVTTYADPVLAAAIGLGCDACSAYSAQQISMPGFAFMHAHVTPWHSVTNSFPGGNSVIARYFVKNLNPEAIHGEHTFGDIVNNRVNFDVLDRPANAVRIRLASTGVRVEHEGEAASSRNVFVIYQGPDGVSRVKAKGVVMSGGSWMTRHVVRDLPEDYKLAYEKFYRSPMLVANVALSNWRFMYNMGLTGGRWFSGFGFFCNIRQPMIAGPYRPPFDPDEPTVLTFYVPFYYPGQPIRDQGAQGRTELLSTSYADYERQIRQQMLKLFGCGGFDPAKDIAGIILNRWGHAYLDPQPGFYFGRDGKPAPRDIVRKLFGRIAFAHSELMGHQNWSGAVLEGRRAVDQLLEVI